MALSRFTTLFLCSAFTLAAQGIHVGLKGGLRLTDSIKKNAAFEPQDWRFTVGPSLELGLPFNLGVEADLLYRRNGYAFTTRDLVTGSTTTVTRRDSVFDLPIMLKKYYGLTGSPVRAFVAGGYALRTGLSSDFNLTTGSPGRDHGFVAGSGVQIRLLPLRVSAEGRFTHWNGIEAVGLPRGGEFKRNANQFEVLFGLGF